jgi:hypothetical protein
VHGERAELKGNGIELRVDQHGGRILTGRAMRPPAAGKSGESHQLLRWVKATASSLR